MKTFFKIFAVAAVAVGLTAGLAHATPTLLLTDGTGGHSVTITDGSVISGATDSNPAVGAVTWIGDIGLWTLNVDTGFTKPAVGSATNPVMDIHFSAQSPSASTDANGNPVVSTLSIFFSENGFTSSGSVTDQIGGTMGGSGIAVWDYVIKNWNTAGSQMISVVGPLTVSPFADSNGSGVVSLSGNDVLSVGVVLQSTSQVIVTGDKFVSVPVPDGGTTAMLLGLGLLGVGFVARRFKSSKV
jgi:hypothetical protein